jgi:hypothetical protein
MRFSPLLLLIAAATLTAPELRAQPAATPAPSAEASRPSTGDSAPGALAPSASPQPTEYPYPYPAPLRRGALDHRTLDGEDPSGSTLLTPFSIGFAYRNVSGISVMGGEGSAGVGGAWAILSLYGRLSFFYGSTSNGITIYHVKPGFMAEARVNRVHLGGGAQLGFMGANGVTSTRPLRSFTFGLCANVSLDLYQWSKASAWTIDASGLIDVLGMVPDQGMLGVTVGMGVRL